MKTDLHVSDIGEGEPIVFIHGAFDPAEETFGEQKELADRYHVVLVDRRGYGDSPAADRLDFHAQVEDILSVVGEGAHLVGQSSGGLLCLLAAAAHPQAVWTLTVIEPTAMSIARGNEGVERLIARLAPLFPSDAVMSPEQFAAAFYQALGFDAPSVELDKRLAAAAATTAREPAPWDIEVPLDRLTAAPFSTLVVSGAWDIAPPLARETAVEDLPGLCYVRRRAGRAGSRACGHCWPSMPKIGTGQSVAGAALRQPWFIARRQRHGTTGLRLHALPQPTHPPTPFHGLTAPSRGRAKPSHARRRATSISCFAWLIIKIAWNGWDVTDWLTYSYLLECCGSLGASC